MVGRFLSLSSCHPYSLYFVVLLFLRVVKSVQILVKQVCRRSQRHDEPSKNNSQGSSKAKYLNNNISLLVFRHLIKPSKFPAHKKAPPPACCQRGRCCAGRGWACPPPWWSREWGGEWPSRSGWPLLLIAGLPFSGAESERTGICHTWASRYE